MFPKFHIVLLVFIGFFKSATGQGILSDQPEQDACGAVTICGNFNCPYSYRGNGNIQEQMYSPTGGTGCFDETNSVWLKLKIMVPGTIVFTITPANLNNNYNFSVFASNACSNLSYPIRCNGSYVSGLTGISANPSSTSFESTINANTGDTYFILIDNHLDNYFSATNAAGFDIDFSGSTATFGSDTLPRYSAVRNTCNKSQQVTVQMTKPVKCLSIASDGSDFYLTPAISSIVNAYGFNCTQVNGGNGYTDEVTIQFNNPLPPGNYWLHARSGTDANTVVDLCSGEQALPDSIAFIVDPYTAIVFTGIDSPACQFLVVGLSHKVLCDSIAADGSDFKIVGPSPVAVVAASGTNCDIHGLADTILVALRHPLSTDGSYSLVAKIGTDHNTLMDSCTAQQLSGDQISFMINSYNGKLVAFPDTILCKADTIQLFVNNLAWMSATECGIDTDTKSNGCFSFSREATGLPGTTFYSGSGPSIFPLGEEDRHGARKQMLFRASELQNLGFRAGTISKIGWTVNDDAFSSMPVPTPWWWPAPFVTCDNFTIKMGCTNLQQLSSGSVIPGLQQVYTITGYTPVNGINDFMLDIPYNWDGISNLIVEVCQGANQLTTNIGGSTIIDLRQAISKTSITSFNSTFTSISLQSSDGCSLQNQGGTQPTYRPDTRFTICSPPVAEGGAYHWSPASLITGDTTSANTGSYPPATTTFTVSTTDRFGCYLRDTIRLVVSGLDASVQPSNATICEGDKIQLESDAGVTPSYFNWVGSQISTLTCVNCNNPVANPLDSTLFHVIISDKYGCSDTLPVTINVVALPIVIASPRDTIIRYGSNIQLSAAGADTYSWSPVKLLSDPLLENPVATILEPTDFIVTGFLHSNGCRNSDMVHIGIDYRDNLFIPSVFSPNNDGINDLFKVVNLSFQKIQEFRVFNRWGQSVYAAFDNKGWDGTLHGEPQDIGIYNYLIKVGFPDGYSKTYKGDVTLLR